jgi:acyl dehydratase
MAIEISSLDQFRALEGQHLGFSDYITIDQERINEFAKATGDFQWIHVDEDRAAQSSFGSTIAHGFLTLSVAPVLLFQVLHFDPELVVLNYGTDSVRFPATVPVNSRLRAGVEVSAMSGGRASVKATLTVTIEIEGGDKPACIAELIIRVLPAK